MFYSWKGALNHTIFLKKKSKKYFKLWTDFIPMMLLWTNQIRKTLKYFSSQNINIFPNLHKQTPQALFNYYLSFALSFRTNISSHTISSLKVGSLSRHTSEVNLVIYFIVAIKMFPKVCNYVITCLIFTQAHLNFRNYFFSFLHIMNIILLWEDPV